MKIHQDDFQAIIVTIQLYFNGAYEGDAPQLVQAFHPSARITGSIQGNQYDWSLEDFIERVCSKPTAKDKQEIFDKEIIAIDKTHDIAMVKTKVVASDITFIDYITLLKTDGMWYIRHKSFTG